VTPQTSFFIDPPYNVDYEGYTEERLKIRGDRMSATDFKQFLEAAFRSCRTVSKPGASLYVCHSSSWQREFQNALETAGFEVRCQIIWAKNPSPGTEWPSQLHINGRGFRHATP
jgi:DNA modification methylase